MAGGEADIKAANPPPDLEPRWPAVTKWAQKAYKKAEKQPTPEHPNGGLKKHSLWLCKFLNGVKIKDGLRERYGVVHTGAQFHRVQLREKLAASTTSIEQETWVASTQSGIISERIIWALHYYGFSYWFFNVLLINLKTWDAGSAAGS